VEYGQYDRVLSPDAKVDGVGKVPDANPLHVRDFCSVSLRRLAQQLQRLVNGFNELPPKARMSRFVSCGRIVEFETRGMPKARTERH
jgi:hypothetical protein